jgi:hypothetical protein
MPKQPQLSAIAVLLAGTLLSSPVAAMMLPPSPEPTSRPIVFVQHGGYGFSGYGGHGFGNGYRGYGYGGGGYHPSQNTSPMSGQCCRSWHGDGAGRCVNHPIRPHWPDRIWPHWPFTSAPPSAHSASHPTPSSGDGHGLLLAAAGIGGVGLLALTHHAHHQQKHTAPSVRVTLRADAGRVRLVRHATRSTSAGFHSAFG